MAPVILDGHNDLAYRVWQGQPAHAHRSRLGGRGRLRGRVLRALRPRPAVRASRGPSPTRLRCEPPIPFEQARRVVLEQAEVLEGLELSLVTRVEDIVPGRVNAIMHLEGAEPLAPDLSDLEQWYEPRAALARAHLVAPKRLRRGRPVPRSPARPTPARD